MLCKGFCEELFKLKHTHTSRFLLPKARRVCVVVTCVMCGTNGGHIAKNVLLCAAAGGFRALKSVVIVGDGSLSSVLSWLPARHEPKLTARMDHNDALEVGHLPFMAAPVYI